MADKATDVRAKTPDELSTMLLDLRKEQFNLRFQRATGQQEGVGRVKLVRRADRAGEDTSWRRRLAPRRSRKETGARCQSACSQGG